MTCLLMCVLDYVACQVCVLPGLCFIFSFCDYYVENGIFSDCFKPKFLVCNPVHTPHYQATSHHYNEQKKKKILNNMQMTCTGRNSRTTDHF